MRKPTIAWLVALLLAFILGFVLAWWLLHQHSFSKPACPQLGRPATTAAEAAGAGSMQGGATPGDGTPTKLPGGGEGSVDLPPSTGTLNGSGAPPTPGAGGGQGDAQGSLGGGQGSIAPTTSSGMPGATHDDGDIAAGGGKGKLSAEGDALAPAPAGSLEQQPGSSFSTAPGDSLSVGPSTDPEGGADDARHEGNPVVAADYRYDKSGLPHYPNALRVASGTDATTAAAAAGPDAKNFSITEIITADAPDLVAAWYHDHVPQGWVELQMPSAASMDQAIEQTKTPAANSSPVDAMLNTMIVNPQLVADKPGVDAARAAGLAIFQPPDQNADPRMIIVIRDSKTGNTGVLLMKKKADQQ